MTDSDHLPVHPGSVPIRRGQVIFVDDIAQAIRYHNGENKLGAGALAEKLIPHIEKHYAALAESHAGLLTAMKAAVACGMIPITSAKEGGASAYSEQVRVADMIRDAITRAERAGGECV